jgi:beta-1,4-mannosyl-glycoprotein beta-1,4-N-acetylglucosaminyltransferase
MCLNDNSVVIITDLDEIPNPEIISHIKKEYNLNGIFKLEMDNYFGSLSNKQKDKWYHPKVINWGNLKSRSIEGCRLTFDCQWWERGGWHFTYFGGPSRISAKLNDFSHQEYNTDYYKDENYIFDKIKNGKDLFGEWREFVHIDPEKNEFLPKNWRILLPLEEKYKIKDGSKETDI